MIDADGSTDPAEIPLFVGPADGRRRLRQGLALRSRRRQPRHHPAAQGSATTASTWWSTCCSAPGSPTCATATTRSGAGSCPPSICRTRRLPRPADGSKLWGDGFEIETMINIRAAADGLKVGEVGSVEHARIHGESNLNTFRDGFRVLRTIFSEYGRMRRRPAPHRAGRPRPARPTPAPLAPACPHRHGRDRDPPGRDGQRRRRPPARGPAQPEQPPGRPGHTPYGRHQGVPDARRPRGLTVLNPVLPRSARRGFHPPPGRQRRHPDPHRRALALPGPHRRIGPRRRR